MEKAEKKVTKIQESIKKKEEGKLKIGEITTQVENITTEILGEKENIEKFTKEKNLISN